MLFRHRNEQTTERVIDLMVKTTHKKEEAIISKEIGERFLIRKIEKRSE